MAASLAAVLATLLTTSSPARANDPPDPLAEALSDGRFLRLEMPEDLRVDGPPAWVKCRVGNDTFACFDLEQTRRVGLLYTGYGELYEHLRLTRHQLALLSEDRIRLRTNLADLMVQAQDASVTMTHMSQRLYDCATTCRAADDASPSWVYPLYFAAGVLVGVVAAAGVVAAQN